MARKHHRPQVHYGTERRGSLCGLPSPRFGAGITQRQHSVTCQSCLAILEATSPPTRPDPHAKRQYRIAIREYADALAFGCLRPARWVGDVQAAQAVPVR